MTETALRGPSSGWERLHDGLLVALVALRPLVWSGDGGWDDLAYLALIGVAMAALLAECWAGRRAEWRWGWSGLIAMALWLALLPAALRSPAPAHGWGEWGALGMHLVLAAYLMQVMPGRERLAFAALAAGALVESAVALLQRCWVLPAIGRALQHGDDAVARLETRHSDLAERVQNGGIFGTFTLANTLAGYLLLVIAPLAAAVFARGSDLAKHPALAKRPELARGAVVLALALALWAFAWTSSKGAYLAIAAAGGVAWLRLAGGWKRWLPLPLGALAVAALMVVPSARAGLEASASVRLGYWRGAATLIGERPLAGHGLGGFADQALRAMPLDAEPTRYAHNELLEAWVDGGVLAALLLAALLARLVIAAQAPASVGAEDRITRRADIAALPLILLVPMFCALGMLASNLGWWPAADGDAGWLAWTFATAVVLAISCIACARAPMPPACAWRIALGAFAAHCLIDFDLHSPALWGMLAVIACLGAGSAATIAITRARLAMASVAMAALVVGLWFGSGRALDVQRVATLGQAVAASRAEVASSDHGSFATLAYLLDEPAPAPPAPSAERRRLQGLALERMLALARRWPLDTEGEYTAITLRHPGEERLAESLALVSHQPHHAAAHDVLTQDLVALGRWDEAIAAQREAVRLAPANLARRNHLADLLELAAAQLPARAAELRTQAEAERIQVKDLLRVVHPRNLP